MRLRTPKSPYVLFVFNIVFDRLGCIHRCTSDVLRAQLTYATMHWLDEFVGEHIISMRRPRPRNWHRSQRGNQDLFWSLQHYRTKKNTKPTVMAKAYYTQISHIITTERIEGRKYIRSRGRFDYLLNRGDFGMQLNCQSFVAAYWVVGQLGHPSTWEEEYEPAQVVHLIITVGIWVAHSQRSQIRTRT